MSSDGANLAHYYLYADCKTPGCKGRLWLSHLEFPDVRLIIVDYPDEWFPVEVLCNSCGQTHSYRARDVGTQSSHCPHHPPEWKPILPDPLANPKDIN